LGGSFDGATSIDPLFADLPTERPAQSLRDTLIASDLCLYVYTSGTTGLPKAAKLSQARTLGMMRSFIDSCRITERDRIYLTLPLYHGTGGICGVGQALLTGATIILRKKFSASAFWEDAVKHKATSFVYIGELCRYLMNTPEHPLERQHTIRKGFGNGLRAEVWGRFVKRFNIPHLVEFYGSTEGNVSFMNYDGKIGAVGRLPSYMRNKIRTRIVKFDVAEEKPIRDKDGFCIETDPDEVGEAIGQITEDPRQRFDGYNDKEQTEKKILRDVFEHGDMWFRTGDLMKMDKHAYIYFVDRIGDTFRWKSENVSTNEVAEAIATFEGIELPNVYGVEMPDTDGRAGMAAVNLTGNKPLNLKALAEHVDRSLPAYARPLFIRIQPVAETTGTFKYRKVELVKQGFDIEAIDDPVFIRLPGSDAYTPMTSDILDEIEAGEVKF
jgi:fatty-acyl-CoA synthase